jgi:hypothetical protein
MKKPRAEQPESSLSLKPLYGRMYKFRLSGPQEKDKIINEYDFTSGICFPFRAGNNAGPVYLAFASDCIVVGFSVC